jgi:hypothetical protein
MVEVDPLPPFDPMLLNGSFQGATVIRAVVSAGSQAAVLIADCIAE